MDNQKLEELFNETFSGLTLFYRDMDLPDNLISNYQIGQILVEPGFTDMTWKGGGLTTNLRYIIASAFGRDPSMFIPEVAKFGMTILKSESYFKVLDIYKIGNKTQILLLNIPSHGVDTYKNIITNIEEQIIEKARHSFDEKLNLAPIEELQESGWINRTSFPIGMDDKGEMFCK